MPLPPNLSETTFFEGVFGNNNGLFDLAATAGLETQSTYILHTEHKKI